MRLEGGQKPKLSRFQGPKALFTRMQVFSKELKWNLQKRCIYELKGVTSMNLPHRGIKALIALAVLTLSGFALSAPVHSIASFPAQEPAPPAKPAEKKPSLQDFAWLAGRWEGKLGDFTAEQIWMTPKNGAIVGMFRLTGGDKTVLIELFTVRETPEGIAFYFRHFTPELKIRETGDATMLKLTTADAKRFEFENAVDGQPKNAILTRTDENTYTAHSDLVDSKGKTDVIELVYHRAN
jgi:hypothetical protein